jgi:hypothetical protein
MVRRQSDVVGWVLAGPDDVELFVGLSCAESTAAKAVLSFSAEDFVGLHPLRRNMRGGRTVSHRRFHTEDFTETVHTAALAP